MPLSLSYRDVYAMLAIDRNQAWKSHIPCEGIVHRETVLALSHRCPTLAVERTDEADIVESDYVSPCRAGIEEADVIVQRAERGIVLAADVVA